MSKDVIESELFEDSSDDEFLFDQCKNNSDSDRFRAFILTIDDIVPSKRKKSKKTIQFSDSSIYYTYT